LQKDIDSHLDYVDSQQSEHETIIDMYEKNINTLLEGAEFKDSLK
jgi:hypothetical protein